MGHAAELTWAVKQRSDDAVCNSSYESDELPLRYRGANLAALCYPKGGVHCELSSQWKRLDAIKSKPDALLCGLLRLLVADCYLFASCQLNLLRSHSITLLGAVLLLRAICRKALRFQCRLPVDAAWHSFSCSWLVCALATE